MTISEVKTIFLQDVGEPYATDSRLDFLEAALYGAIEAIERAGVTIDAADMTPMDANLVRMYAAWYVRGRASREPMPPQLRFELHSRLFSEKMSQEA